MRAFLLAVSLGIFVSGAAQIRFASFTNQPQPAKLSACTAEVVADPFIATTTLTLEFLNPGKDTIEGRYQFDLPEGTAVTGFQLELNGVFRDGSIEERWAARNAYQKITGQRIDPALLEMPWANHYTVRIFPIAGKSVRRIRITVKQLMKALGATIQYRFPLESTDQLDRFSASAIVTGIATAPVTDKGFWSDKYFHQEGTGFQLKKMEQGMVLLRPLSFDLALPSPLVSCTWTENGLSRVLAHIPVNEVIDPSWSFAGFRLKGNGNLVKISRTNFGMTVVAELMQADTIQVMFTNGLRQVVDAEYPLTPPDTCSSTGAKEIGALVHFADILQSSWDDMLVFGVRSGIVTPQTAYIVLERVEDYINYGIKPPKELEEECARQNYVWKDRLHILNGWTEIELIQEAVKEYNRRILQSDPKAEPLIVKSLQGLVRQESVPGASSQSTAATGISTAATQVEAVSSGKPGPALEEVVVTALGLRRKPREIGYSTSIVRADQITAGRNSNLAAALSGKVSGLQIQNTSASVNAVPRIMLRGMRSLTGNNSPLIVVDGVQVPSSNVNFINPNDVERIDVLKGGQASTLYGSEGVNGAIIITTKRGRSTNQYSYYDKPLYKLKEQEDVDYVLEFKAASKEEKQSVFQRLRELPENRYNPLFYIDMAVEFWKAGFRGEAKNVLLSASTDSLGNRTAGVIRGQAYILEEWGLYDEAIRLHNELVRQQNDLRSRYDLGLSMYQAGRFQQAVDIFYDCVKRDWGRNVYDAIFWKGLMLQELNEIVFAHRDSLNLSKIPADIIKAIPAGLRIQTELNTRYTSGQFAVKAPGKPGNTDVQSATQIIGEYQQQQIRPGKYQVLLNHFYNWHQNEPVIIRIIYRVSDGRGGVNFTVRNQVLNNQWGSIEVDDWKYQK
jgi:TonB-dependent SusC/RagA subfamily outer membrane receptor